MKKENIKKYIKNISVFFLLYIGVLVTSCRENILKSHNNSYFEIEYKDYEIILHQDDTHTDTLFKRGGNYYDANDILFLCFQKDTVVHVPRTCKTIDDGIYNINYDKDTDLSTTRCYVINRDENNNETMNYYSAYVYDKYYHIKKIIITQSIEYY